MGFSLDNSNKFMQYCHDCKEVKTSSPHLSVIGATQCASCANAEFIKNKGKSDARKLLVITQHGFYTGVESLEYYSIPQSKIEESIIQLLNNKFEWLCENNKKGIPSLASAAVKLGHYVGQISNGLGNIEIEIKDLITIE